MAQRRMLSQHIMDSDAFLEMPPTSQLLYVHFCMRADDDGFVGNPKRVMRMVGSSEDDFKVLLAKRFILQFESGVIVIKHWRIHNYIQNDRYHETKYLDEKKCLEIKENGAYTECILDGYKMDTQVSLGKVSLGKVSLGKARREKMDTKSELRSEGKIVSEVIALFKIVNPSYENLFKRKVEHTAAASLLQKFSFEQIETLVTQILPQLNADRYSKGKSITPSELERNLGHVKAWVQQKKNSQTQTQNKKFNVTRV